MEAQDDYEPSDSEDRASDYEDHEQVSNSSSEPLSFSRIDPSLLHEQAGSCHFPNFPGSAASISCSLEAGVPCTAYRTLKFKKNFL